MQVWALQYRLKECSGRRVPPPPFNGELQEAGAFRAWSVEIVQTRNSRFDTRLNERLRGRMFEYRVCDPKLAIAASECFITLLPMFKFLVERQDIVPTPPSAS
jgi:hypothetical protein